MNRFVPLLLALSASATLGAAAIGFRADWLPVQSALKGAEWAVYIAIGAFVLALVHIAIALLGQAPNRPRGASIFAVLFSLPLLIIGTHWEQARKSFPPINDITTDTQQPPDFWDMPNPSRYPGTDFATLQAKAYPDIQSLRLRAAPERVFAEAMRRVQDEGWMVVSASEADGQIEAVATSLLFGFEDEVVIRVQGDGEMTIVDMRSHSRIGKRDFGANAKRIRRFLSQLKQPF